MSRKEKKYHYIYKTTCSLTKRYYYGMHSTNNLNDGYLGSGSELSKSIKRYGREIHSKKILEYLLNRKELKEREIKIISKKILQDPLCMNLSKGNGSDFGLGLVTVKDKNGKTFSVSINDSRYLSGELVYHLKGKVTVKDKNGKTFSVSINDSRYLSGELVHNFKGHVTVKDKNGKTFNVSINDSRYLSGELVHNFKGMLNVKNKNGNIFSVSNNDPRYLSGELVGIWKGQKHSKETIEKMKLSQQGKQKGYKNSQFDTCWITNGKQNKKIKKEGLIPNGWELGRKIKLK